jgi:ABC-type dipeptide/oligopeptide/nickel transport system ATPase component
MTPPRTPLLNINLTVDYPTRPGVLDDVVLELQHGEIVGLVGSSGSGKSSLALAVLRLLEFKGGRASGEILFRGRDLMRSSRSEMRDLRGREIGFIPQSPSSFLNPAMRIDAQMAEAWRAHKSGSRDECAWRVNTAIERVGLPADRSFLHRYPSEVSVGQAQRVLIAMAILHHPSLLIADEPTSALDVISQAGVLHLLARLNREMQMGILFISHDLLSIAGFCQRVAILHEGRIVESADTSAIFETPSHAYTRQLIAAMPQAPSFSGRRDVMPMPA